MLKINRKRELAVITFRSSIGRGLLANARWGPYIMSRGADPGHASVPAVSISISYMIHYFYYYSFNLVEFITIVV